MIWRFDQGRLDYFNFDEIKRMARGLSNINGVIKPDIHNDILRYELSKYSQRPFAPNTYTVWRNYKRVFACALLATEVSGHIVATDLCKIINAHQIDADDYFAFFAQKFYYPSPIFEGYNINEQQVFPVPAILKFILAKYIHTGQNNVTIEEIGAFLITNNVTGVEPLQYFEKLTPKKFDGDLRQVRELVRFISQFSFLKWDNPYLYFDVFDQNEMANIISKIEPIVAIRNPEPGIELLNMSSGYFNSTLGDYTIQRMESLDKEFSEGNRIRVTHVRTERSTKLKDFYFKYTDNPEICNMCGLDTHLKYPWSQYIIEIHHLLPLSSPARVESKTTSIQDVTGICPTCHRAIHKYYNIWLLNNNKNDFDSKNEAYAVYQEAKRNVC
jgi:hypothetical protein